MGLFPDATIEREWEDGYALLRMRSPQDLIILGQKGGGCSRDHHPWVCSVKPLCEYFFVVVHPDGKVGMIYFCKDATWMGKRHPQDDGSLDSMTWIRSDHYDKGRKNFGDGADPVRDAKRRLGYAKEGYEEAKRCALRYGKLGKENPYKSQVDAANKEVTSCLGLLDQAKLGKVVSPGFKFKYEKRTLFVVQKEAPWHGGGVNGYTGSETRYTDRFLEFVKENK